MNTIKTILLTTLSILSVYTTNAQTFKEPVAFKLKNGMNIIISENERSPKAYASFTLDNTAFDNKKDGIVELLNAVLNESVEKNGTTSFNDNSGKLATTTANLEKELTAMASLIQNANIDQKIFNNAKAKLITSLKLHDYDYDQTVNESSINALSLNDVKEFYSQISPEKTYLTIAGDVEINAAKATAKKAFGNWNKAQKQEIALSAK
ncbi:insulinase family protein [Pedobacter frigidisoli]|uniref:Insulinase family protein n=1 Tax=Pedobacter frigidisoli TaxID=2530455 RepID=A0A4R0P3C2_9SPHI|nr:insulinase family protein [Pedobacter frigidisoli]TCD08552.1 insulinase family protein [Pedobacter frigidisoli]